MNTGTFSCYTYILCICILNIFTMSLYTDIQKMTQIPCSDENLFHAQFILQTDNIASKRNRKMMRRYKPPKNVDLYDNGVDDDFHDQNSNDISQEQCCLPENEIASSIKEATGGIDYSNENLEEQWRIRQTEASLNSRDTNLNSNSTLVNNCYGHKNSTVETNIDSSLSEIKTAEKNNAKDEEVILRKCKLNKNAAIRGLLKNRMITAEDLEIPVNSTDVRYESNVDVQNTNIVPSGNLNDGNCMKLVQYQEDPDVFMQPLQAHGGIDESKYKDIDFTVPHIGTKTVITPRQFFLNMDDSDFDFVRKDTKNKK